jgi:hypothetical protein
MRSRRTALLGRDSLRIVIANDAIAGNRARVGY